jgi:hypothetical protein
VPRREVTVVIEAAGRDQGKTFIIKEMPSQRGEDWATRLLLALAANGVQVPDNFFDMGMAGVAALGIRAIGGVQWAQAKPLLDEMMSCVRIQPNSADPRVVRALIDSGSDGDDIEEIGTRVTIREAWITLHTGFSIAAELSKLRTVAPTDEDGIGQPTETSVQPSAR